MPNDTEKVIQNMIDQATDAGVKIPEIVPDIPETVTETVETVPEPPESVTLPAEIELEPKTTELVQQFSWNFEEIKAALTAKIEKYTGLVVTDQNLKEMEKTQKEIAGLRTKIGKFKHDVKMELDKPYQQFDLQIKQLVSLVASVEKPIVDQIEKYEVERKNKERVRIQELINTTASECKLEEKFSSQIVIDERWLNRGAKKKDVLEGIQTRVAWFLDIQAQERQAELFKSQKVEMSKLLCQTLSVGLATPLTFEEIESRIESMTDIVAVKTFIEGEVARRKEREERAAQLAVEQAAAVEPTPPAPPIMDYNWLNTVPEPTPYNSAPPMPPLPPVPPPLPPMQSGFMPPIPPLMPTAAIQQHWSVILKLPGITIEQAKGFKEYLAASGITYEIVSQEMVK